MFRYLSMTVFLDSVSILYVLGLCWHRPIWGDKESPAAKKLTRHPWSIAYRWPFIVPLGPSTVLIGEASRFWAGAICPILLGPIFIAILFGFPILRKMITVSRKQKHSPQLPTLFPLETGKRTRWQPRLVILIRYSGRHSLYCLTAGKAIGI